jgi:hypothetical protein
VEVGDHRFEASLGKTLSQQEKEKNEWFSLQTKSFMIQKTDNTGDGGGGLCLVFGERRSMEGGGALLSENVPLHQSL